MTRQQLLPKAPKRKRQPTAACMREQLALAADEIIRLRELPPPQSFWRQLLSDIGETPPAELPAWARIIRAFQRKS